MNGQPPPNKNIPINIAKLPEVRCQEKDCGGIYFRQVFSVKYVPPLLSPDGHGGPAITPVFVCDNCGTPLMQSPVVLKEETDGRIPN